MTAQQLALELKRPDDWSREAFLVGASNQAALDWVERWPAWPQSTLALYGPSGCGKTHLCHIASALSGAPIVSFKDLALLDWRAHPHVILDNGPVMERDESALFHSINWAREQGGSLLMTSTMAPSLWDVSLKDARSRLNAIVAVEIGDPSDVLLSQLLVKHFSDLGTFPSPDVIAFLERRIGRSFGEVGNVVYELNRAALAQKAKITVPFVKRVLGW